MEIVLVHGAYHGAWCWELLIPELERLGHTAHPVDLPISDPLLGAAAYAEIVGRAVDAAHQPILVGHSIAGLVTPIVAATHPVSRLVFLAALLPDPGRSANDQRAAEPVDGRLPPKNPEWTDLGDDVWMVGPNTARELFFHDAPVQRAAWATARLRAQAYRVMSEPTPLTVWPEVASDYIICRADRAVNPEWGRRAAHERLGVEAVEIDGGHSPFLTRPGELARVLDSLVR